MQDTKKLTYDVNGFSQPQATGITSICFNKDQTSLLIGTSSSQIHEIKRTSSSDSFNQFKLDEVEKVGNQKNMMSKFIHRVLMTGHYAPSQKSLNEVWGLVIPPESIDQFYTCADDGTVRLWSISQKSQIGLAETTYDITSSKNGETLIDHAPKDS